MRYKTKRNALFCAWNPALLLLPLAVSGASFFNTSFRNIIADETTHTVDNSRREFMQCHE